jgi:hypothetical protein
MNLICNECKANFTPIIREEGRMPKGYKICPICRSANTKILEE